jgi:type II secretory pathway pseudopilin PulG
MSRHPTYHIRACLNTLPSPRGREVGKSLPSPSGRGIKKSLPSPSGRGAGGEGCTAKSCERSPVLAFPALTPTLSQRERGPIRGHALKHGFTLVELVSSIGVASLLMGGLASVMYCAGRTLDHDDDKSIQTKQANDAFDDMAADLAHATGFTERTAHAVTFTVPDRSGDEVPETIRYSWSGTAGNPLQIAYNGGTPATLAANVQALNLSYLTRSVTGGGFVKGYMDDAGPVAWWKFDDGAGTKAKDSTTNKNDGALINSPTWTTGHVDGGLQFDGKKTYVSVPYNEVLTITNELTLTAWIRAAKFGASNIILAQGTSGTASNYELWTYNGKLVMGFYNGGWRNVTAPNALTANTWYHVAATVELSGTDRLIRLYQNGVEVYKETTTYAPLGNKEGLTIGKFPSGAYWDGILDDIRIYNRKLSADEILQIYKGAL